MPATAAATLSKTCRAIWLSPRMSTTEWTTIMSRVPTSGPKSCRPEAMGEMTTLGAPMGNLISAAAVITAPSAPPIPIPPTISPSA